MAALQLRTRQNGQSQSQTVTMTRTITPSLLNVSFLHFRKAVN